MVCWGKGMRSNIRYLKFKGNIAELSNSKQAQKDAAVLERA